MVGQGPVALYLARAESAAEAENAASIGRRLTIPVLPLPIARGLSLNAVISAVEACFRSPEGTRVKALVVNAFLGVPTTAYRDGATWPLNRAELRDYIDLHARHRPGSRCLLSLQVVWTLWQEGHIGVPVLVTTGEVHVGPEARLAIADAFGDGLTCVVEDWRGRWRGYGQVAESRVSA